MARTPFPLQPSLLKDDTDTVAEGNVVVTENIRYSRQKWESCGGYTQGTADTYTGVARGAHAWADNNSVKIAAWGTANKLYAYYGGSISDITPVKAKGTLSSALYTKNGSAIVLVLHARHGLFNGDTINFQNADAIGGITLSGDYTISFRDLNSYWVTHSSNASSDAGPGGGNIEFSAPLEAGRVDGVAGAGYGVGAYGLGAYGNALANVAEPTEWRIGNWGQNLLALRCGGALYEWQPRSSYPELYFTGAFTTALGGSLGTGWSVASDTLTAAAGSASDAAMDVTGILGGGISYEITMVVTRSAGSFQFRVRSEPEGGTPTDITFGATINKSFTYTRRFTAPASPTTIKIAKDNAFIGTVKITSLKIISVAYRLQDAPAYSLDMMVDPQDRVIVGGTVEIDEVTFNAMHLRWSDIGNNRTWDPDTTNGAGFETLRDGSRIMSMDALKAENLVYTDTSLSYMRRNSTGYDIKPISGSAGIKSRRARAQMDGIEFFWGSDDQLHIYQGGRPQIIEIPFMRDVTDNLAASQNAKITATIYPRQSEVWFQYADGRDGNECSRQIRYNWAQQTAYADQWARSEWIAPGVFQYPIGFGIDGKFYYHETGHTWNGAALEWRLKTGALDLGLGDTLENLMCILPDFADQQGAVTIKVYLRNNLQDDWTLAGTYTATVGNAELWMRHCARQMQLEFSQSANPAFARFGAVMADIKPSGARR